MCIVCIPDEATTLVEYENSHAGMIKSWSERFPGDEAAQVDQILHQLYERDLPHF